MYVKQVAFAYATSETAHKFGRAERGCYIVEVGAAFEPHKVDHGPFETVREAEAFGDAFVPAPWSTAYLQSTIHNYPYHSAVPAPLAP